VKERERKERREGRKEGRKKGRKERELVAHICNPSYSGRD
jgi:hypothetical protein